MSTYLQLCQSLRKEATDSGTGPTTVVGNTGELARFCKWVSDGYQELQASREDWLWLRGRFTVNATVGLDSYAYGVCTDLDSSALITRFSRWYQGADKNGFPFFTAYLSSTGVGGEYPLIFLEWDTFRRLYKVGTQNNSQPVHYTTAPDRTLYIGPKPDDTYVVQGVYQKSPQVLALDADVPEMPTQFHNLIVYEGLSKYGGNRVAPEAMLRAASEGGRLQAALEMNQLPAMSYGGPLA